MLWDQVGLPLKHSLVLCLPPFCLHNLPNLNLPMHLSVIVEFIVVIAAHFRFTMPLLLDVAEFVVGFSMCHYISVITQPIIGPIKWLVLESIPSILMLLIVVVVMCLLMLLLVLTVVVDNVAVLLLLLRVMLFSLVEVK